MARVSSDTVANQMAHTSLNSGSPSYCGSPMPAACSPLTTSQHTCTPSTATTHVPGPYPVSAPSPLPGWQHTAPITGLHHMSYCYSQ